MRKRTTIAQRLANFLVNFEGIVPWQAPPPSVRLQTNPVFFVNDGFTEWGDVHISRKALERASGPDPRWFRKHIPVKAGPEERFAIKIKTMQRYPHLYHRV